MFIVSPPVSIIVKVVNKTVNICSIVTVIVPVIIIPPPIIIIKGNVPPPGIGGLVAPEVLPLFVVYLVASAVVTFMSSTIKSKGEVSKS